MNIVLVGAGGSGVSAIAGCLHDLGYQQTVCIDSSESEITKKLEKNGMKVIIGHGQYQVKSDDIVIYSEATKNSPEVQQSLAYTQQLDTKFHYSFNYFQFLGEISKHFFTVGVAGTNGKSSTTALMIDVLSDSTSRFGLGIVGALSKDLDGKNYKIGPYQQEIRMIFDKILFGKIHEFDYSLIKKYFFVVESCEFRRHFLSLDVDYSMITNVELDHSDYFVDLNDYRQAFDQFFDRTRYQVFVLEDEPSVEWIRAKKSNKTCLVPYQEFAFEHLFGKHNHVNASFVFELIQHCLEYQQTGQPIRAHDALITVTDVQRQRLVNRINSFKGIRRRIELLIRLPSGALLYSDYGHYPTSLQVVQSALREHFPGKKIIAIFQPHQAKRVLEFWNEFVNVLKVFDQAVIYKLYTAREDLQKLLDWTSVSALKEQEITTFDQIGTLFAKEIAAPYETDFTQIANRIRAAHEDEIVVIFTAGDLDYLVRKEFGVLV